LQDGAFRLLQALLGTAMEPNFTHAIVIRYRQAVQTHKDVQKSVRKPIRRY